MAITTREGLLRVRGGMVQFRKVDGKFWRDLVQIDTLLELQAGDGVGGGGDTPPPTTEPLPYTLDVSGARTLQEQGWTVVGGRPAIENGAAVLRNGTTRADIVRDIGRTSAFRLRATIRLQVDGTAAFYLGTDGTGGSRTFPLIQISNFDGVEGEVFFGTSYDNFRRVPADFSNGSYLLDATVTADGLVRLGTAEVPFGQLASTFLALANNDSADAYVSSLVIEAL